MVANKTKSGLFSRVGNSPKALKSSQKLSKALRSSQKLSKGFLEKNWLGIKRKGRQRSYLFDWTKAAKRALDFNRFSHHIFPKLKRYISHLNMDLQQIQNLKANRKERREEKREREKRREREKLRSGRRSTGLKSRERERERERESGRERKLSSFNFTHHDLVG